MQKLKTYFISILVPILIGGLVGFITSSFMDYKILIKPPLSPPSIVFPIVWTILYILMGISYGMLKITGSINSKTKFIYYFQLFVNAMWSIFFFVLKWRLFSFFWILLLGISVFLMIREFYKKNKLAGLLQLPYLVWILFATYLNLAIYLLNR